MRLKVPRKFAWASVGKPVALFLLPLPLLIAIAAALIEGDLPRLALAGSALAAFWAAGVLAFRGLVEEARYRLGERLAPAACPWKRLSAFPTALGSGLAATSAGHDPAAALAFAALAGLGHLAFIGTDPARPRITISRVEGDDDAEVGRQLERAVRAPAGPAERRRVAGAPRVPRAGRPHREDWPGGGRRDPRPSRARPPRAPVPQPLRGRSRARDRGILADADAPGEPAARAELPAAARRDGDHLLRAAPARSGTRGAAARRRHRGAERADDEEGRASSGPAHRAVSPRKARLQPHRWRRDERFESRRTNASRRRPRFPRRR